MNKWYKFSLIAIVLVLVFYLLLPSNDSDTSKLNEVVNKEIGSDKKILSKKNKESRTSLTYKIDNIKNIEVDESSENTIKNDNIKPNKKLRFTEKKCVPDLSGGPIGIIKNILSGKQICTRRIISEPIKKNSKNLIDVTYLNTLRLHFFIAQELLNINISSASASQLLSLSCLEKTKIDDVVRMYEDNILEWEELFKIPLSDKRWQEKKDEVNAIIDGKTYAEGSESNFVESFHECL